MRLLVVAHDASRSGSPRVLAALLGWLRRHRPDVDVEVVLQRDGPLRERLAPVRTLAPPDGRTPTERLGHGLRALGRPQAAASVERLRWRRALRGTACPDLVLLNSAPAAEALGHLPWRDVPVVAHLHELDGVLAGLPAAVQASVLDVDRHIAASQAVATMLVQRMGVDPGRVLVHHEVLDPDADPLRSGDPSHDPAAPLGIPARAPVVLGAGARRRRKGLDLFVQLAVALRERRGPAAPHLVWVGPPDPDAELWPAERDVQAAGLTGRVHLVPEVIDLGPWLARADVLAVPSREDPYPLVCLEASWWATPFVAFAVGGIAEIADGAAGRVVPPLDLEAMADAVLELLDEPARAAEAGEQARAWVQRTHLVEVAAPALWHDVLALAG